MQHQELNGLQETDAKTISEVTGQVMSIGNCNVRPEELDFTNSYITVLYVQVVPLICFSLPFFLLCFSNMPRTEPPGPIFPTLSLCS